MGTLPDLRRRQWSRVLVLRRILLHELEIHREECRTPLRGKQIQVEECTLGLHDFYNADEVFLTGSGAEIVPVVQIDGRQVSDGKPGPNTKMLLERYQSMRVRIGHKVDYEAATITATD